MDSSEPLDAGQEVLSQAEVERLLAQVAEQYSNAEVLKPGGVRVKHSLDSIQPYDFRQPVFLSAVELRKLRLRQEEFARSLAARLSIYLRMEFTLQLSRLQTLNYQKFLESLQTPTHLSLFRADPLRGIGILDIPPQLGVTIVDRLLGGTAQATNLERDLSDIEAALLDQAVHIILNEWCSQWASLRELRPVILGHESNARFLQTASHDTVMLAMALEVRLGECQDTIQMGFPCYTLEPLMRQLSAQVEASAKEAAMPAQATGIKWNRSMEEIMVPVTAGWDGLEITARDLARLQVGDVIQLSPQSVNQTKVHLARIPKFTGRLGRQDDKWAVELTQVLKT
jgi:flagellar motor switch protein FliM